MGNHHNVAEVAEPKKKSYSEIFSDERFEVILDKKADELIVNDKDLDITVSGEVMLKNRHRRRLESLVSKAKEIEVKKDESTVLKLDEYSEEKDPYLYTQEKMLRAWSLDDPLNRENILEAKQAGFALDKFAEVILKYNGLVKDSKVEEKK